MRKNSRFKATGSNDLWFAVACLIGIVVFGLVSQAESMVVVEAIR